MNPRTCIATRSERSPDEMIRFVLDGEDRVVPDLHRKLPGRGVWVTNGRKHVEQVIKQSLFSRGFKKQVTAGENLVDLIDQLMESAATGLLSMARKAGVLIPGRANIEKALSNETVSLVLHAKGSDGDGRKKLDHLVGQVSRKPAVFELFESETLDQVCGVANTRHLAVADGGISDKINGLLTKLETYRSA